MRTVRESAFEPLGMLEMMAESPEFDALIANVGEDWVLGRPGVFLGWYWLTFALAVFLTVSVYARREPGLRGRSERRRAPTSELASCSPLHDLPVPNTGSTRI